MPPGSSELRAELEALALASAVALASLRAGEEAGVLALVERRERLLAALAGGTEAADASVVEAARRAVALDGELVALMRQRLAGMGREVEVMTHTRRSLSSYGAAPAGSSVFVERLG